MKMLLPLGFGALLSSLVSGCGTAPKPQSNGPNFFTNSGGTVSFIAQEPHWEAFDRSLANPTELVVVNRKIALNEFQGLVEQVLSKDQKTAVSVITGFGMNAVDLSPQSNPLNITLG